MGITRWAGGGAALRRFFVADPDPGTWIERRRAVAVGEEIDRFVSFHTAASSICDVVV
jgi:hypothetical protein